MKLTEDQQQALLREAGTCECGSRRLSVHVEVNGRVVRVMCENGHVFIERDLT